MRRVETAPHMFASVLLSAPGSHAEAAAALGATSSCVLLDLERAGPAALAGAARALGERWRDSGPLTLVRLAPLDDGGAEALSVIAASAPDTVVATRAETGADLQHLGALLAVEEARAGLDDGSIGIVAMAETTAALFGLIGLSAATQRLIAISWDGEALGADFGDEETRDSDGRWSDPLQTARTLALAAAADAGLPAIDGPFSTRDRDAFRREAERARRDGFAGKVALDAAQTAIANEVFGNR